MIIAKDESVLARNAPDARNDAPYLSYSTLGWIITVMFWGPIWVTAAIIRTMSGTSTSASDSRRGV